MLDDVPMSEEPTAENTAPNPGNPAPGLIHHPDFYFDDDGATLIVQVEDHLYKLYRGPLMADSEGFRQVLGVPVGLGESNVVHLGANVTRAQFDAYLNWKYRSVGDVLYKDASTLAASKSRELLAKRETFCVDLLEFSKTWIISLPRTEAIQALQTCKLKPARRLYLACVYNISEWVKPAVASILRYSLDSLSLPESADLGITVYRILALAREKYVEAQQNRLYTAPQLEVDPSYGPGHDHEVCRRVWKNFWWNGIAKQAMAPYATLTEYSYPEYITKKAGVLEAGGMHASCIEYIVKAIDEGRAFAIDQREGVISGAESAILDYIASSN